MEVHGASGHRLHRLRPSAYGQGAVSGPGGTEDRRPEWLVALDVTGELLLEPVLESAARRLVDLRETWSGRM